MKPETLSFYELAVRRALDHVFVSLDEALDLVLLARVAALSPFHFHRIFRGMVGETPLELHRRLRMERAAWTLLQHDTPVTTIALEAGYDTHEAFTRAFRVRFGCSPKEFRQGREQGDASCFRSFQIEIATRSGIHFDPNGAIRPIVPFIQGAVTMNVEMKSMPQLRCATLRHIGPYNRISEAFARLGQIASRAGLIRNKPVMIALYKDDPEVTPQEELQSDAAIVVPEDATIPDGLVEQRIGAGTYACTLHKGSYEQIGDSWARFMGQWLPQSGHRLGEGPSYEIYVNNPAEVSKDELLTELYIPIV